MEVEKWLEEFCVARIDEIFQEINIDTNYDERMNKIMSSLSEADQQWLDDYLRDCFMTNEDYYKEFYLAGMRDIITLWKYLQNDNSDLTPDEVTEMKLKKSRPLQEVRKMEKYDIGIRNGVHRVKVTLQQWQYVGHIWINMGGNCYGKALLDFDFECEDGESENDCELKYHENEEWFTAVLKDQDGNSCRVDGSAADFNDMIVAVEIVSYEEKR